MLDAVIKFSIKNKIIIGLLTLSLIIWGIWSASRLPIDAVPDITDNQVQIITICPTLAGQEVEQLVTFPIEQSIANVPNLDEIRSISRFGLSVVTAVFYENTDIYFARQLIHERLQEAVEQIPIGIGTPELAPVSTGLGEVYQYILRPKAGSEANYSAMDLRTMQDWIVARQLRGTPGVAEINSFGGQLKQYEVSVNPDKLKSMDIGIPDIFDALEVNNQNTGGAYIDKKPNAYFIRGIGLVNSLEDIGNIVVKSRSNSVPILIRDVAEVRYGSAIRYGALTYNGEVDAVGGVVMMLKGHNSNEVVQRVKAKIPTIQQSLPDDVVIEPYLDRTELVGRAMGTVEKNLVEGALIVIFVLVVFLGNLRAGLIVASSIPLAMLFALGMMNVFGVSANLMSLGAIDFGLIVDGAVIVVEAALHHLGIRKSTERLTQREMDEEVYRSASKIRTSAAFGEIIILIVYIPILTLVGIEGKMFRPMAMTVGFAILGALILSLTYIPVMCALFLPKAKTAKTSFSDRMMARLQQVYRPLLEGAMRIKYVLIGTTAVIFAVSLIVFSRMGGEFIPQLEEGDFAFHCILPQGTSLSQSVETSMLASRIIKQFDEVKMVVGKTGAAEVPTDPMPPEATDLMIILNPKDEWPVRKTYKQLADEIMEKLTVIPGVFFESNQPIQMRFNELMTGIRQDVAVKIFGENLDSLLVYANQVSRIIQGVEGITAPQVERIAGLPQINVVYDRARIANYGLSVSALNDILSTAFAGKAAGLVFENERRFELVVRLDSVYRSSIADVANLWVPLPTGEQVPLSQLAQVSFKIGPAQISREDGKRRIVIGFNLDGRDVASAVAEIQAKLQQQVQLPAGYYYTYGGMFENLQKASNRLMVVVPISLALIFMLLFFTFNTFRHAALIFTAIPMSAIGGVCALLLRGMPFSISAGIGFIALFGVVVLNGIVLIGTFNQLEKEGWTDVVARVLEGTKIRLRPVLMTAAVASLGFLPMALSNTAGAEVQRPLATVVIGGLLTATFLTLFILPLLYVVFDGGKRRRSGVAGTAKRTPLVVFLTLLAGIPQASRAQLTDCTNGITIEQAISMALANNQDVLAAELHAKASESMLVATAELPKAEVGVQSGSFNSLARDNAFQLSQAIPFPTVFGARRKLYQAEAEASRINREITVNTLKNQVRTSFYYIQYLLHRQDKLTYLDSLYADASRAAFLRYQTGEASQLEMSMADTKRGEIKLLLEENGTQLRNAYRDFSALLNMDGMLSIAPGATYEPVELTTLVDNAAVIRHPIIRELQQRAFITEQRKRVETAQTLPDVTVGYTNQSLVGTYLMNGREQYFGRDKRFGFVNVGIAIPLTLGATKGRIRAMEYQQQAAEAVSQQAVRMMEARLLNAYEQYELRWRRYQYFVKKALPNAERIIQAAQLGYQTGEITYVEYLYALQTSTDVELDCLEVIQSLNQAVIDINFLLNN